MALTGAVFTLTKAKSGDETQDTVFTRPMSGEVDTGSYSFADLPDGSYTLVETPPEGYEGITGPISFTVTDGQIVMNTASLPDGVEWDGSSLTLTVMNKPVDSDQITVRKQWLDADGNADAPGESEVTVTLKRKVDVPQGKKLKIVVQAQYGNNSATLTDEILVKNTSYRIYWPDNGEFQWVAARLRSNVSGDNSVRVQDGISTHGSPSSNGNNMNAIWVVSNLGNLTQDTTITFTYQSGYSGDPFLNSTYIYNALGNGTITFTPTGTAVQTGSGEPVLDNWSQEITLSAGNNWSETLSNLPQADGNGNQYHYFIKEESVPQGYNVPYSDNNDEGITSGILTAYNQKTSIDLTIVKVDRNKATTRLDGASFRLTQLEPETVGPYPLSEAAQQTKVTGADGATGTLVFSDLEDGYYMIEETVAPPGYVLYGDTTFYIKVEGSEVSLIQMDAAKVPEEWTVLTGGMNKVDLVGRTATVENESGASLPSTGGSGAMSFLIGGLALMAGSAAVGLALRRKKLEDEL